MKKLLLILSGLLLIILISVGYYLKNDLSRLLRQNLKKAGIKTEIKPKLVKETSTEKLILESHQGLFIADLAYDPQKNIITQLKLGTTNGDEPSYLIKKPEKSVNELVYRLELLSPQGELLMNGWRSLPQNILYKTKEGLSFSVVTKYVQNAKVNIYIEEKLLWTGIIK